MGVPLRPRRPWQPLGACIHAARLARTWKARRLAALVGVTASTVCGWELGHKRPQPQTLRRLATLLDIDYAELAELAAYPVEDG